MKRFGVVSLMFVGFVAGIIFVYSCGGGGSIAEALTDVTGIESRLDSVLTFLSGNLSRVDKALDNVDTSIQANALSGVETKLDTVIASVQANDPGVMEASLASIESFLMSDVANASAYLSSINSKLDQLSSDVQAIQSAGSGGELMSIFLRDMSAQATTTWITLGSNEVFILTDVVALNGSASLRIDGTNSGFRFMLSPGLVVSFRSGLVFNPNDSIILTNTNNTYHNTFTLSGYKIAL